MLNGPRQNKLSNSVFFTLVWFGKFWFLCWCFPCFRLDGRKKRRKFFSSFFTFRFICAERDHSNLEKMFLSFWFPTVFEIIQTLERYLDIKSQKRKKMAPCHSG